MLSSSKIVQDAFFLNLINNQQGDYSRYIFFYINYLIENKKIEEAKAVAGQLEYINSTLITISK